MADNASKGNAQANSGDVCNHLSAFSPAKTAMAIAASNCEPRPAYRRKNFLLSGGSLLFIVLHFYNIGTHMALAIKSSRRFYL